MAVLGSLKVAATRQEREFLRGSVRSMGFAFGIALDPTGCLPGNDDRDPTHRVRLKGFDGVAFDAGAAWEMPIKRGENEGKRLYSISIDPLPELPMGLRVSAFPDGEGCYRVEFERPRQSKPAPAAAEPLNDEVPF